MRGAWERSAQRPPSIGTAKCDRSKAPRKRRGRHAPFGAGPESLGTTLGVPKVHFDPEPTFSTVLTDVCFLATTCHSGQPGLLSRDISWRRPSDTSTATRTVICLPYTPRDSTGLPVARDFREDSTVLPRGLLGFAGILVVEP